MIPVEEALARITGAFHPLGSEQVALGDALGRVLAEDLTARITQPPVAVSAMDGYAVRASDVRSVPSELRIVGEAPAGRSYGKALERGEAVRIFTGGPVPEGADAIVIQENTRADGSRVTVLESPKAGVFIRPAGLDFKRGDLGLPAGEKLTARDIALAAAMNAPAVRVSRRPRIAILSTGDELVPVGDEVGPDRIVGSNGPALRAFIAAEGAVAHDLGIARDSAQALQQAAKRAEGADLLVTTGGVSVGDHDLVQSALGEIGLEVDFWKVAMRPGRPLLFGRIGDLPVLGFPGNPVSVFVCALVYLRPAIEAMLGRTRTDQPQPMVRLGSDLAANDSRQSYLRATLSYDSEGNAVAIPFSRQDSSMLAYLATADCLVIRPPRAPAIRAGAKVPVILLDGSATLV